jgi:hypothetical protein
VATLDPHHLVPSSLNGSNGEWTGDDDLAARHGQIVNLNNRGAARRGGNQYGPPGLRPVHPDNMNNNNRARNGNDRHFSLEPGEWSRHQNGAFAGVKGSFLSRVVDDNLVPKPMACSAGERHGAYNAGVMFAESTGRQVERRLVTDDMAREIRVLGDLNRDLASLSAADVADSVDNADRVSGANIRARHELEKRHNRRVCHQATMIEKQDIALIDEAIKLRQLEDSVSDAYLQARFEKEREDIKLVFRVACDPELLAAHDAKIVVDCESLKRNAKTLREINALKHDLADVLENGPQKSKFAPKIPITFETPVYYVGGRLASPYNPALMGDPRYVEAVHDVPLAAGIIFCRRQKTSTLQWIAGGLATMWKKTVSHMDPKTFSSWDKTWVAPTNHRDPYASSDGFLGTRTLLLASDRRAYRSILDDYRVLGFQCQTLFNLLNAGEDFIRDNGFTHTITKWVHPTLYQEIMKAMVGIKITVNSMDQICRDAGKNWIDMIPYTLFNDTIELACQHTAVFNHGRAQTTPRLKNGLGSL